MSQTENSEIVPTPRKPRVNYDFLVEDLVVVWTSSSSAQEAAARLSVIANATVQVAYVCALASRYRKEGVNLKKMQRVPIACDNDWFYGPHPDDRS